LVLPFREEFGQSVGVGLFALGADDQLVPLGRPEGHEV
jgi:hypothetical protein